MSWVATGVTVAGAAAGYLGGSKGKKAEFNPYGQLNPEQIAVNKTAGNRINAMVDKGPEYYSGQLSAEMSPQEAAYYNTNRGALMSGTVDQMLQEANDPVAMNNAFRTGVVDPTYQNFNQNIAPGIAEDFSAFGTQGANKLLQARQTLGNDLATQRFNYQNAVKDRALNALGKTSDIQNYMAAPRAIKQAGLDRKYQDYVQGNAQYQQNLDNALRFLGVSTSTYTPGTKDTRWSGMLQGAAMGASLGSGIGGGFSSAPRNAGTNINLAGGGGASGGLSDGLGVGSGLFI